MPELVGNLCAYIKPKKAGEKARYPRIGTVFKGNKTDLFSIKIDSIPIDPDWDGWCNVYPPDSKKPAKAETPFVVKPFVDDPDDDIPF